MRGDFTLRPRATDSSLAGAFIPCNRDRAERICRAETLGEVFAPGASVDLIYVSLESHRNLPHARCAFWRHCRLCDLGSEISGRDAEGRR